MIDVEADVLAAVSGVVSEQYPDAFITGIAQLMPSQFPCVAIYESGNEVNRDRADSSHTEKFAYITYTVDVSSNKRLGAKGEARGILSAIDGVMYSLNFTRVGMVANDSYTDSSYYRVTARYQAEVSSNRTIYRR